MVMGAERIGPGGKNSNIIIALLSRFPISDALLAKWRTPLKGFKFRISWFFGKLSETGIVWNCQGNEPICSINVGWIRPIDKWTVIQTHKTGIDHKLSLHRELSTEISIYLWTHYLGQSWCQSDTGFVCSGLLWEFILAFRFLSYEWPISQLHSVLRKFAMTSSLHHMCSKSILSKLR